MLFTMLPAALLALAAAATPQVPANPNDTMRELNGVVQPRPYWEAALTSAPAVVKAGARNGRSWVISQPSLRPLPDPYSAR